MNVYIKENNDTIELLGHTSSKTTEIYTHVTNRNISKIKSPLDEIMEN